MQNFHHIKFITCSPLTILPFQQKSSNQITKDNKTWINYKWFSQKLKMLHFRELSEENLHPFEENELKALETLKGTWRASLIYFPSYSRLNQHSHCSLCPYLDSLCLKKDCMRANELFSVFLARPEQIKMSLRLLSLFHQRSGASDAISICDTNSRVFIVFIEADLLLIKC